MKITLADLESWLDIHLAGNERAVAEAIIEAVNVTVTKWHGAPDRHMGKALSHRCCDARSAPMAPAWNPRRGNSIRR